MHYAHNEVCAKYKRSTNKPPASAMRGFGAPQTLFAAETQMNMAAEELGIDPIDLRLRNAMRPGDSIPGVATISSCGSGSRLPRATPHQADRL